MTSSDSSDCEDGGFVRVSSANKYPFPPEDIEFALRVKPKGVNSTKLMYTLKKEQKLPYQLELMGFTFFFGMDLKPSMGDKWDVKFEKDVWHCKEKKSDIVLSGEQFEPPKSSTPKRLKSLTSLYAGGQNGGHQGRTQAKLGCVNLSSAGHFDADVGGSSRCSSPFRNPSVGSSNSSLSSEITKDLVIEAEVGDYQDKGPNKWSNDDLDILENLVEVVDNRVATFKCSLCSFLAVVKENCFEHIVSEHKDWRMSKKIVPNSPHTNRGWMDTFKANYYSLIVAKCSASAQEASATDEEIKDLRRRKLVRNEIVNTVVDYLVDIHGGISNPKLAAMREVVVVMGNNYPNMFQDQGNKDEILGYGFGGAQGIKKLPGHMVDRVRGLLDKKRRAEPDTDAVEQVPKKRGKKTSIYGVDNRRFLAEKNDPESTADIARANEESDTNAREKIYDKNRPALCSQIRTSTAPVGKVCRGFFLSPIHLSNQFSYLTGVQNLKENVQQNLKSQIGFLELFLLHEDKSLEFKNKMEEIRSTVETDYHGDSTFKDVEILRLAGTHFDQDGSVLFLLQRELPAKTNSPFILVVELPSGGFVFELFADKSKLLGNLDLPTAITAFLELCFVFNLRYPKEAQTLANLLQRRVADYGDDTGTRTICSKTTALSKESKYLLTLGRLLTKKQ